LGAALGWAAAAQGSCREVIQLHRRLGYEPNEGSDISEFQGLDGAGSDSKALKRRESTLITSGK